MAVVKITKENFENEVMQSEKPVLIDFWASWCGPCKMLSPIVDEVASEVNNVKICKVNIDDEPELASQFQVMSIPTLVFIKNNKIVNKTVGVQPKKAILDMISK